MLTPEQAVKRLDEIRKTYAENREHKNFSALIMGEAGTGKTHLLSTARKPLLIDHFDPRGTIVIEQLAKGLGFKTPEDMGIFIRPFWAESSKTPTMYRKWEQQWERDRQDGFLSMFASYAIDSGTTFIDALSNKVRVEKNRGDGLAIQDYQTIYNIIKDTIKLTQANKCDFYLTGHIELEKNEADGSIKAMLGTYKSLRIQIPLLFTEKYTLIARGGPTGVERYILTQPEGIYMASTQIGTGKFKAHEEPDIRKLLEKVGYDFADRIDSPILKGKEPNS